MFPTGSSGFERLDETLRLMDDELETNSGSEFFAWMAATLNKLKNVARS